MSESLFPYKILLGSKSPRRSYLMRESGFDIEVHTIDVDESYPSHLESADIAEFIANKKADVYQSILMDHQIGLVADTIVCLDGKILEKPSNKEEASYMLEQLSGNKHIVYTGVVIFNKEKKTSFTGKSEVYFLGLSPKEIEYYIDKYAPYDKAGSYGVQEWIGYTKIQKINGSYSNIMGLPMEMVYEHLFQFIEK